ncbi:MAG: hypothetical protein IPK19_03810 [Chloroflexi bacterium]|nr:hypothetical protein [Chloroflexota bacterium]
MTDDLEVIESVGVFGQPVLLVQGVLRNASTEKAFRDISLRAEIYDATEAVIGEGVGYPVDACGAGWLPDDQLFPEGRTHFEIALELFEAGTDIKHVDVYVSARRTTPQPEPELAEGFTRLSDDEVIEIEWLTDDSLRYAAGCDRHPLTEWQWNAVDLTSGEQTEVAHPAAELLTPEVLQRLSAADPAEFEHAFVRFSPDGDRMVFQAAANDFMTAALDGRFQRAVHGLLHNRSLRGVYWQPEERFLAYYFGGYGDPVVYFTATAEARAISPSPANNRPSLIVPGISRDANRAVIAGEFGEGMGYYIVVFNNGFFEKLFEAEPPGNNYPAPLLTADAETNLIDRIYVALDDANGAARLMCFSREDEQLHDLAPLPMRLTENQRAAWWLSPDEQTIALGVTGIHGGLWTIDLTELPPCAE